MSVYKVTKQGEMFAYRVAKSREWPLIGFDFFEGFTLELPIQFKPAAGN